MLLLQTVTQASDLSVFAVDPNLSFADLTGFYPLKTLHLKCRAPPSAEVNPPEKSIGVGTLVNAFKILLAGAKVFPEKKTPWYAYFKALTDTKIEKKIQQKYDC